MFIASVLIQYFVMSLIMTNSVSNITNSLSKFYISIIMGLLMCIVEFFSMNKQHGLHTLSSSLFSIISIILLLAIFIYLYRSQIGVYEKEYLNEMIEHHSMAILTSKQLLEKGINNPNTIILAKNIINTQEKEIKIMKNLLSV